MLPAFRRILNSAFFCALTVGLTLLLLSAKVKAQSYGDPLVRITFGNGASLYAGPLHPDSGYTSYNYVAKSPEDNDYTIASSTTDMNRGWVFTTDHTGGVNGMMMIVNASYQPGLFYTRVVNGLCGSTQFEFSAWIKNILRRRDGILPNVSFTVEDQNGNLLGGGGTADIEATDTWNQYKFAFRTPANVQSVVLKMINNAPGGGGNDIAIDDIEFRPYGAQVNVVFDRPTPLFCQGIQETINMRATTPLQNGYAVKFQMYTSNGWIDLRPAGTNTSIAIQTPAAPGTYNYRMVTSDAGNIDSPPCVVSSNFLSLTVLPLPTPVIDMPPEICMEGTMFKEASRADQAFIKSYLWDFGDGTQSSDRNPTHTYATPGNKVVKLTITNTGNCTSTVTKTIRVIMPVNTDFRYTTPGCQTQAITFTDVSASTEGVITKREWTFDDSTATIQRVDNAAFDHTFARPGTYNVKLTITTDKGCVNSKTYAVRVAALPEVNFTLPEVCYADYYAQFRDSSFVGGSNAGLTYRWDFGDSDASLADNTSTLQNPQHHFSRTALYTIKLTVRTADGCEFVKEKQLQVNGYPIPRFDVPNKNAICAAQPALFINRATASAGNVTKIEWFFDAGRNATTPDIVDDEPRPDKPYTFKFPALMYPQTTENYTVRMKAYTGQAGECQEFYEETITVLAGPVLEFTPPEVICLNNGVISLKDHFKELSGIPGAVQFSGPGVKGEVFDPTVAGVGQTTIKAVYTASISGACAEEVSKTITIKPIPTNVDAGANVFVLAGNKTSLNAVATGANLKYKWLPANGLSNDTIPNPVVTLSDDVTYTLRVALSEAVPNGAECYVEDIVKVTVLKMPQIPNTFTPNGDGINDFWDIKNLKPYDGAIINVFNRNGQRVFASIGYGTPWDGRMNGDYLPVGVYYYIIDPKHGRAQVSGYVTIVR